MEINVGDRLQMKKPHPCGSAEWLVLRVGVDFKLRCDGCGHEVLLPRKKAEKNIKRILSIVYRPQTSEEFGGKL